LELNISPLQILLKKIYLRKIIVENIKFNLIENEPGLWNLASLTKETEPESVGELIEEQADSLDEGGGFPFIIQANQIQFRNLEFTRKVNSKITVNKKYDITNFDDLKISDLNLTAKAIADLAGKDYQLILNKLSFDMNVNDFKMNDLSGAFQISKNSVAVKKLNLVTDSSNIGIDIVMRGLNIFDDINSDDFKDFPTEITLKAKPFCFSDLAAFVPETGIKHGNVDLDFIAGGLFGELGIHTLLLDYRNTHLDLTGSVYNLHIPSKLYFDVILKNSTTGLTDVNTLLPALDLPDYKSVQLDNFNLAYKGTPAKFSAVFDGIINNGKLDFNADLDFSKPRIEYNINFNTLQLDLSEIVNEGTLLSSKGSLKGKSVDLTKISAKLVLDAFKSNYNGYSIDSLHLDVEAQAKIIQLSLSGLLNKSFTNINGKLDLTNPEKPFYDLAGNFKNLDLYSFTNDSSNISSLNFSFKSEGEGLDLDKIAGEFTLDFDESIYKKTFFEDAVVTLKLKKEDNLREIDLTSNFVDFTINGDFSLNDAVSLLAYQGKQTSEIISDKIAELDPIYREETILDTVVTTQIDTSIINKKLKFDYSFEFKDFDLIASIIGEEELGIAGTGGGSVSNDSSSFYISTNLNLDYFYTLNKNEILYLSNLETNINFSRDNSTLAFDNLFGALSVSSDRIIAGSMVKNFTADFVFNQSKLIYNVYTEVDTFLSSNIDGHMMMRPGNQLLEIDEVIIQYKKITWTNHEPVNIEFSPDSILFNKFRIFNDSAYFDVSGLFTSLGNIDMTLNAGKLPSKLVSYYVTGDFDSRFQSEANLIVKLTGNTKDPKIAMDFQINDIILNEKNLGNLYCKADYYDKNCLVDFKFLDADFNLDNPYFQLSGNIPINVLPEENESMFDPAKLLNLKFLANDFNVAAFGNAIPTIRNQEGFLTGNIDVTGTFDDLQTSGYLSLYGAKFLSDLNNLEYKVGMKINFDRNTISVDSLRIANLVGSRLQGAINGNGIVKFEGFIPEEADFSFEGGLGVLGKKSKSVSRQMYGNLFVQIKDKWNYSYKNNKSKFVGSAVLRGADLIFTPIQSGYSSDNNIVYIFKVDSSKIDKEIIKFDKLVASKRMEDKKRTKTTFSNFDYSLNVEIENEAKIEFILSPEFNQKLLVFINGKMRYESIDEHPLAQGQFTLLDGSELDFFKVFDAEGYIRFETKVSDPYLNILATYRTDWVQEDNSAIPVAVKMKIEGNFSELGENLAKSSDNILVYVGNNNINNNVHDTRYDAKNALSFILVNKPDFAGTDRGTGTFLLRETSYSVLGSALTSLINSRIGDAINDINLSETGTETRLNVSGKIENIRYSVGVSDRFSDNPDANLRIEYLFNQNFLVRVERKSSINSTVGSTEKINELGVKYIFVF
jgi:hypothetical protein